MNPKLLQNHYLLLVHDDVYELLPEAYAEYIREIKELLTGYQISFEGEISTVDHVFASWDVLMVNTLGRKKGGANVPLKRVDFIKKSEQKRSK